MAHRFKKAARALQELWDVPYTQALQACIDTSGRPDFNERLARRKGADTGESFKTALIHLTVEDWSFCAPIPATPEVSGKSRWFDQDQLHDRRLRTGHDPLIPAYLDLEHSLDPKFAEALGVKCEPQVVVDAVTLPKGASGIPVAFRDLLRPTWLDKETRQAEQRHRFASIVPLVEADGGVVDLGTASFSGQTVEGTVPLARLKAVRGALRDVDFEIEILVERQVVR